MSSGNRLRDNVERWLIHENYKFTSKKNEDYNFNLILKNVGSYGTLVEIFEPKKQQGVLVIGAKTFFKNNQTLRYNKLNDSEHEKFHDSVKEYCDSIYARNKIFKEDGKVVIEVFVVLDKVERFTQELIMEGINKIIEMSEKVNRFVLKTF